MEGLRAEIVVDSPGSCPVAAASATTDASITGVDWSERTADDHSVTEEIRLTDDVAIGDGFELVFEYDDERIYRFEREAGTGCVCERIAALDCPIADVTAEDGSLTVTLHLESPEELKAVITELQSAFSGVHLRSVSHTGAGDRTAADLVSVDRSVLTDRQREVLETADRMGFFSYPREANASEVAGALGISDSTFIEHLTTAQAKLLDEILVKA
ncbi:MAG: helix-turn-helix domain-containing protein [Halobacteriales archaeon]|nr:helix-turn-helix domain-containing protein [Halobacteriales archaeon]